MRNNGLRRVIRGYGGREGKERAIGKVANEGNDGGGSCKWRWWRQRKLQMKATTVKEAVDECGDNGGNCKQRGWWLSKLWTKVTSKEVVDEGGRRNCGWRRWWRMYGFTLKTNGGRERRILCYGRLNQRACSIELGMNPNPSSLGCSPDAWAQASSRLALHWNASPLGFARRLGLTSLERLLKTLIVMTWSARFMACYLEYDGPRTMWFESFSLNYWW